ncbi:MAG: hypothetical protein M5R40_07325 [Anaerolineae bacterium]|nr:hypothetical protein [Anaerolineae bacterium]
MDGKPPEPAAGFPWWVAASLTTLLLGAVLVYGWGDRKSRELEDIASALRDGAAALRRLPEERRRRNGR